MRAYFFGNFYLSSIQQGIQAGHCIAELFTKYQNVTQQNKMLFDWAEEHKTMILLNAGHGDALFDISDFLNHIDNPFPHARFNESESALGGVQTVAGIILPDKIYDTAATYRRSRHGWDGITQTRFDHGGITVRRPQHEQKEGAAYTFWELSPWEMELIERLTKFGLAK